MIAATFGLQRQMQLLGFGGTYLDQAAPDASEAAVQALVMRLIPEGAARCIEETYDVCLESGSYQVFRPMLLGMLRQSQLLGGLLDPYVADGVQRMRDCGHYELQIETDAMAEIRYPVDQCYASRAKTLQRGSLEVQLNPEWTLEEALPFVWLSTPEGLLFDPPRTVITCQGRHGERCLQQAWNGISAPGDQRNLDGQPGDVKVEPGAMRVKFVTTRAMVDTGGGVAGNDCRGPVKTPPRSTGGTRIVYVPYRPEADLTCDKESDLMISIDSPELYIDVMLGTLHLNSDNLRLRFLDEKPLAGWAVHDPAADSLVFSKTVQIIGQDTDGDGNPRRFQEKATLKLIHEPQFREGQPRGPDVTPGPAEDAAPRPPAVL